MRDLAGGGGEDGDEQKRNHRNDFHAIARRSRLSSRGNLTCDQLTIRHPPIQRHSELVLLWSLGEVLGSAEAALFATPDDTG